MISITITEEDLKAADAASMAFLRGITCLLAQGLMRSQVMKRPVVGCLSVTDLERIADEDYRHNGKELVDLFDNDKFDELLERLPCKVDFWRRSEVPASMAEVVQLADISKEEEACSVH